MGYWSRYYSTLDRIWWRFDLNPDLLSLLSILVLFPLPVLYYRGLLTKWISIPLILCSIFLDYLDGVFARKIGKADEHIDMACDRISEFLISTILPQIFMVLTCINVWISILRLKLKIDKPVVLPLRLFAIFYILFN